MTPSRDSAGDSLKIRIERINRRADFRLENLKRFNHGGSIAERYVDGVLSFHVHIAAFRPYAVEYFSRTALKTDSGSGCEGAIDVPSTSECNQLPVLVWVRDVTKGACPSGSFVRLIRLDSTYVRGRQAS